MFHGFYPSMVVILQAIGFLYGISICYDFMDLERAVLYRGRVQHLLAIVYSRNTELFKNLAISLSRIVFCNVIICNTGHYGGSIAASPYHDSFRRIRYLQEGGNTFSSQVIELPVSDLYDIQKSGNPTKPAQSTKQEERKNKFKDSPRGFMLR